MGFLINDRSLHGQFHDPNAFKEALITVMGIRAVVQRFGRTIFCHRSLLLAQLGPGLNMQQAAGALPGEHRRALMQWITQHGPFWEDDQAHNPDDWFQYREEVVTETALAEAAFAKLHGIERQLISFAPSKFNHKPVEVDWVRSEGSTQIEVENHWSLEALRTWLEESPSFIASWADVEKLVRARCDALTISKDAFHPLVGRPFSFSAAERLVRIFTILNRSRCSFQTNGSRTSEGHELYQNFFTGKKGEGGRGAMFSDSSDTEKCDFKEKMTFRHPDYADRTLFCPWHAKVQTPQLRVHFSFPISSAEPLYVVYVGPKLTGR